MSETTNIAWADSTASPFFGCTEQSPGCLHCYARFLTETKFAFVGATPETSGLIRRAYYKAGMMDWDTAPVWGNKAVRVLSKGFWTNVVNWNKEAVATKTRRKVFPSLMDWLDDFPAGVIDQNGIWLSKNVVLGRFLKLIKSTPNIDWLLLTKKIEDFEARLRAAHAANHLAEFSAGNFIPDWLAGKPPHNVWVGVSVEDQTRADQRIPALRKTPARLRFLSVEPLLEAVDLKLPRPVCHCGAFIDEGGHDNHSPVAMRQDGDDESIKWIIVGGESGDKRRDCGVEAIEDVARQCKKAGVSCFVKQASGPKSGQRGGLSDEAWGLKQFPAAFVSGG